MQKILLHVTFFYKFAFRNQNVHHTGPQFSKQFLRNGKLFLLFEGTFIKNIKLVLSQMLIV